MGQLIRKTSCSAVVYYAAPALESIGVPHGFSTRIGGVSPPPFDSLNLGNPNGEAIQDEPQRIERNYHLLQNAIGGATRRREWVHQVHGDGIVCCDSTQAFDRALKADAIITDDPARIVSVRTADCVPILLASADGKTVAAVHAGWRGVVAEIVPKAVMALSQRVGRGTKIAAAIGPCIGFAAFEVGEEVLAEFDRLFGLDAPIRRDGNGKGRVNLRYAVYRQLLAHGVAAEDIDTTDCCTYRDRQEFYSHRRDNGLTGRMAAIIGPK